MSYQIVIPKTVQKQLDKISPDYLSNIISVIMTLKNNP